MPLECALCRTADERAPPRLDRNRIVPASVQNSQPQVQHCARVGEAEFEFTVVELDEVSSSEHADKGDCESNVSTVVSEGIGDAAELASEGTSEHEAAACVPDSFAFSPEDSLIICDWDDTLFPTSWAFGQGLLNSTAQPQRAQAEELVALSLIAAAVLEKAKLLGEVLIVTNAATGWVEWCCASFMPLLCRALEGVRIVSARTEYGHASNENDHFAWKRLAFEHEIRSFCDVRAGRRVQVISLGDAAYEQEALAHAARVMPGICAKSLKLIVGPTCQRLEHELDLIAACLGDLVAWAEPLDYDITVDE